MSQNPETFSLYDYSDKSVKHAGIAALAYGGIALWSSGLAWLQTKLYGGPVPALSWVIGGVITAALAGALAFGIFRRSKAAAVGMLALVVLPQVYTWFIARSFEGTVVSVIIAGFLLRGTKRIFEKPDDEVKPLNSDERQPDFGGS